MSEISEIIVTAPAMARLKAMSAVDSRMYDQRPDGRFNLRVSGEMRRKLDRVVVKSGLSHTGAACVLPCFFHPGSLLPWSRAVRAL